MAAAVVDVVVGPGVKLTCRFSWSAPPRGAGLLLRREEEDACEGALCGSVAPFSWRRRRPSRKDDAVARAGTGGGGVVAAMYEVAARAGGLGGAGAAGAAAPPKVKAEVARAGGAVRLA